MKKYISLVVLGSLFATASLKAMETPEAAATIGTVPPVVVAAPVVEPPSPLTSETPAGDSGSSVAGDGEAAPAAGTFDCIFKNAVIKYIRECVTGHPTTAAVTAGTVVVGLSLWKCPWIRRKLGLEDEDTHRSEEFDVEKLFATNYKK